MSMMTRTSCGHTCELHKHGTCDGSHLSDYEREVLAQIPLTMHETASVIGWQSDNRSYGERAADWTAARLSGPSAVIVYQGEFGLEMGCVRSRRPAGWGGRTQDMFEVSPFPGAWTEVGISQVLVVRHPSAI